MFKKKQISKENIENLKEIIKIKKAFDALRQNESFIIFQDVIDKYIKSETNNLVYISGDDLIPRQEYIKALSAYKQIMEKIDSQFNHYKNDMVRSGLIEQKEM